MFKDAPIVQEAIKKWGSEEALVQAIGEQVIENKGEVIAHLGVVDRTIMVGDIPIRIAGIQGVIVLPEFRRKYTQFIIE